MKWKLFNWLETTKHKLWTAWYLIKASRALLWRALIHDLSKYSHEEAPYLERALPRLRTLEYGSEAYKAAIASLGPALEHHYRMNTHHPEHWHGIKYMSPLDLIEMLCDWKAATRRHATGDLLKSIRINAERFGYDQDQEIAFRRDAREIGL